jgi:hypothetical protein
MVCSGGLIQEAFCTTPSVKMLPASRMPRKTTPWGGVDAGCKKSCWESSGSDCLPNGSDAPAPGPHAVPAHSFPRRQRERRPANRTRTQEKIFAPPSQRGGTGMW